MGKVTKIEWCHSTVNGQMGCDGCELWNPKAGIKSCYAGQLTERHGGGKGWPESFDKPAIFLDRILEACQWGAPTADEIKDKPWLKGYPRLIFLDDMGDTFTESLPIDWLEPVMQPMIESPHIWQFLTKRPRRMAEFFNYWGYVPKNFWLMTTVTSEANMNRVAHLLDIPGASVYGVSYEPMWGPVDFRECLMPFHDTDPMLNPKPTLNWIIAGGQSGTNAKPFHTDWARQTRDDCAVADVPFFWKQNGEWAPTFADREPIIKVGDIHFRSDGTITGKVSSVKYRDGEQWKGKDAFGTALSAGFQHTCELDERLGIEETMRKVGKKKAGRLLDGVEHNGMPEVKL